jgi:ABC-type phosphate/phosphonate transport system substrate-binding protein
MMAPVIQEPIERAVISDPESSLKKMVLGVVADPESLLETAQQAEPLAAYLEASLSLSITIWEFSDMAGFTEWFSMVDFAILSPSAAKENLGRDYLPITEVIRTDRPGMDPAGLVVVPRGQNEEMIAQLQRVLVEMPETADGRSLLSALKISEISVPEVAPTQPFVAPGKPSDAGRTLDLMR